MAGVAKKRARAPLFRSRPATAKKLIARAAKQYWGTLPPAYHGGGEATTRAPPECPPKPPTCVMAGLIEEHRNEGIVHVCMII